MEITSSADMLFTLSQGQQVGQMRRSIWTTTVQLMEIIAEAVADPLKIAERDGVGTSVAKRRAVWDGVLKVTTKITAGCEALVRLGSSGVRAKALRAEVAAAVAQLSDLDLGRLCRPAGRGECARGDEPSALRRYPLGRVGNAVLRDGDVVGRHRGEPRNARDAHERADAHVNVGRRYRQPTADLIFLYNRFGCLYRSDYSRIVLRL